MPSAPAEQMPQKISSCPRNPRKTLAESARRGTSASDKGRQRAFRGGCRHMSRLPAAAIPSRSWKSFKPLAADPSGREVPSDPNPSQLHLPEGVSSNKTRIQVHGIVISTRYDDQRARPQRCRSHAPFCRRCLEKAAFASARFGSTNPCPLQLQRQLPRTGWRTPRASRPDLGL